MRPVDAAPDTRLDVPTALKVGAIQLIGTFFASRQQPEGDVYRELDVLGVLLLAAAAALVFRRRRPVETLAFVLATTLAYYVVDFPYGPAFLSLIVALYTAVTRGYRVEAAAGAGLGWLGYVTLESQFGPEHGPSVAHAAALAAWLLVVLIGSEVARTRRERSAQEVRSSQEEARRRASEERLRIARELHDVVAHNISLINVQAGVALHLIDEQPEQARSALTAIKQASKEALGELRSVLDVLRQEGDDESLREPAPGLDDLDGLVARAAAAGLDVRVEVEGRRQPLPSGVELAAYRIVQEALTNVVRHAGAASTTVLVDYGDRALTVQVDDTGAGPGAGTPGSTSGGGNGIPGMRERVAALGGDFQAGPRPGGGFRVRACLPLSANGDS